MLDLSLKIPLTFSTSPGLGKPAPSLGVDSGAKYIVEFPLLFPQHHDLDKR